MMLTKFEKQFTLLFVLIVSAELICSSFSNISSLHYYTKPAIVIALLSLVFFSKSIKESMKNLTIAALIFSVIGDILLMFIENSPHYFTAGLVSFLTAHIIYSFLFLKHRNTQRRVVVFIIILLIYAACLFYILRNGLGAMLIPVIIYMLVILFMAITAFMRKGMVTNVSYWLVFVGAISFMLSDSLLAINKFYEAFPFSNLSIMISYSLAQYLIVIGIIKYNKKIIVKV